MEFITVLVVMEVYTIQSIHQDVEFSYNPCPDLSKNRGGGFYWKGASIGGNTVIIMVLPSHNGENLRY